MLSPTSIPYSFFPSLAEPVFDPPPFLDLIYSIHRTNSPVLDQRAVFAWPPSRTCNPAHGLRCGRSLEDLVHMGRRPCRFELSSQATIGPHVNSNKRWMVRHIGCCTCKRHTVRWESKSNKSNQIKAKHIKAKHTKAYQSKAREEKKKRGWRKECCCGQPACNVSIPSDVNDEIPASKKKKTQQDESKRQITIYKKAARRVGGRAEPQILRYVKSQADRQTGKQANRKASR
ncbi:uncharacterized protein BJ171DRAFT_224722 [Polychytrium aggregatum]|uniref:uncharacterized protein n=1 Tax=Polychytrium aggregatum TaxID=110093 RepID=UPI0022FF19B4|nr:uncharacterized protein BJ171DRAFT_224722 [Polychytrium aggregatum]KAI9197266.1 hypothetical protein BJ171DRAFT_224722 [Polychytrium aggregatum]